MKPLLIFAAVVGSLCTNSCSRTDALRTDAAADGTARMARTHTAANGTARMVRTAVAQIQSLDGSMVRGSITFTDGDEGVALSGTVQGLQPGMHGFHIHEGVSCDRTGDHYNPMVAEHGAPTSAERHLGDLGNLEANADSTASPNRTDNVISLFGKETIIGHALVIHQGEDDYTTQPSGDSGPEIACGIIELQ